VASLAVWLIKEKLVQELFPKKPYYIMFSRSAFRFAARASVANARRTFTSVPASKKAAGSVLGLGLAGVSAFGLASLANGGCIWG
jgi:hypothetical protein